MRGAASVIAVIYLSVTAGLIVGILIEGQNVRPTLACATIGGCIGLASIALTNLVRNDK